MTIKMGVVADDVTGANDIGSMFAKAGYVTHVYSIRPNGSYAFNPASPHPDIVILDTNSRLDPTDVAYGKVAAATRLLQSADCSQFFNKTCSVFRGNIGVEFDAMLDVLDGDFAVIVLGFPKNGRTTVDGVHYVRGVPLAQSEFQNDPIHPMSESHLVPILQTQTERSVAALHRADWADDLRGQIEQMRKKCNYLILDVTAQADLTTIAEAMHDYPVLCGSSALAETLPQVWGTRTGNVVKTPPPQPNEQGILIVAGSLMPQTRAQIDHMRTAGAAIFTLQPEQIFRDTLEESLIAQIVEALGEGQNVVLHSPNSASQTRTYGATHGLDKRTVGQRVSGCLATLVAEILSRAALDRLIVAGGETSAAICTKLGFDGLQIEQEIQPGLPSCLTLTDPPILLVLKSGSFGTPQFFADAVRHLTTEETIT